MASSSGEPGTSNPGGTSDDTERDSVDSVVTVRQLYVTVAKTKPGSRQVVLPDDVKDAKDLAAEAQRADDAEWLVHDPLAETIDHFITHSKPSEISIDSGVGWICVMSPSSDHEEDDSNLDGLLDDWHDLISSGQTPTLEMVKYIAQANLVTSGKWLIYLETGPKVDHAWEKVARCIASGDSPISSAKVSPFNPKDSQHVMCVYNLDFTDVDQVMAVEKCLRRRVGIKCNMKYKPDVCTHLGIYRRNEWGLKPTIFNSDYDLKRGSRVTETS